MKIVPIFAKKLYSFHYAEEELNEYDRLLELWNDPEYLKQVATKNQIENPKKFIYDIMNDADNFDYFIYELTNDNKLSLNHFFQPLDNREYQSVILSLQKGKKHLLRLYAIKLEDNCFVITGGAIKMSNEMKDHPDTNEELRKIKQCHQYLKSKGIFDSESFWEFICE